MAAYTNIYIESKMLIFYLMIYDEMTNNFDKWKYYRKIDVRSVVLGMYKCFISEFFNNQSSIFIIAP